MRSYAILETPRELTFDRFVFTAAQLFRAPVALLTIADQGRQWCKASVGLPREEVAEDNALCEHTLLSNDVLVVEDASADSRFSNGAMVSGPPYARFFAGVPLVTFDGIRVGALSVIDRQPRTLLVAQGWQLGRLAASLVDALESRRSKPQANT